MATDDVCDAVRAELSAAHDERRPLPEDAAGHVASCEACAAFATGIVNLDAQLGRGVFDDAPDLAPRVMTELAAKRRPWLSAVAIIAVGALIGALVGGIATRLEVVEARDLGPRFQAASPGLTGLGADLVVVERGWHPEVPERVYSGSLSYTAPERMALELVDTTSYPDGRWQPNDISVAVADGDAVSRAQSPCPPAALPECSSEATVMSVRDQRPFAEGVLSPLEIVSPARSLRWWSGMEVVGTPALDGKETIQVRTTVAGAATVVALTERGAWRELHPTDPVLMWLDAGSLVPLRIEVNAGESPERELWQVRRGYADSTTEPIFIVELTVTGTGPAPVEVDVPAAARSGGFTDAPASGPAPQLDSRFVPHRSGRWPLPDGGEVDVRSYSDGGSWLMVESTGAWTGSQLFGMPLSFVRAVELGPGSVAYLSLTGDRLAIHGDGIDIVVSGSVAPDVLLDAGSSLGVDGLPVPADWAEASILEVGDLPGTALVPDLDGWSILAEVDGPRTTLMMVGAGDRSVLVTSQPGRRLDPPRGPDFLAVDVRGTTGRFDASGATLEWVEDGRVVRMRSETVGVEELVAMAGTMGP